MVIPVGYRFDPTDEEIFNYYLKKKAASGDWVCQEVSDCPNFFGKNSVEPWELCGGRGQPEEEDERQSRHFFFVNRKKRGSGTRFVRTVGSGTWNGTQTFPSVLGGSRREFVYKGGSNPSENKAWLMSEYEFSPDDFWVLCVVRRKRTSLDDEEIEPSTTRKRKKNWQVNNVARNNFKKTTNMAAEQEEQQIVPATPTTSTSHYGDHQDSQFCPVLVPDQLNGSQVQGYYNVQGDWFSSDSCQSHQLSYLEQGQPSSSHIYHDHDQPLSVEQEQVSLFSNEAQEELQLLECNQDCFLVPEIIQLDDEPLAVDQMLLPAQPSIPNDRPAVEANEDPRQSSSHMIPYDAAANNINCSGLSNDQQSSYGINFSGWEYDDNFCYQFPNQSLFDYENNCFYGFQ